MDRPLRAAVGGIVYHVLNRANARARIFDEDADYAAFLRIAAQAVRRNRVALLSYCIMPNHWHLVVRPREDGDLSRFVGWLTLTHTQRRHAHRHTTGTGHLYQGRFKSFPVQKDEHFLTLCRYVERNALRANLVERAEQWKWCSLSARGMPDWSDDWPELSHWPVTRPRQWLAVVNRPQSSAEEEGVRASIIRGRPFGDSTWQKRTASRLGLESTLRPRGRPRSRGEGE